jgi:phage regulator Rha-like protein
LKEVESIVSEKKSAEKEATDTKNNTEKLIERYDELNKKLVKTTEEQEEWKNLIADINDQFPEIVSSYDEANGKITI